MYLQKEKNQFAISFANIILRKQKKYKLNCNEQKKKDGQEDMLTCTLAFMTISQTGQVRNKAEPPQTVHKHK